MNVDAIIKDRQLLIGERIKEMRNEAHLTQSQLAALMSNGLETDRGKSTISEYEHGKHLTLENIIRIYSILNNCDLNYLLGCQEHPDITTSWIAEQIPLTRKAIQALEDMKYRLDEWSDSETLLFGYYIISDIIIHIAESVSRPFLNSKGEFLDYDDFSRNVIDLMYAYESIAENEAAKGTPFEADKTYRSELLTIRGATSWLGSDIADAIRQSVKHYADRDHVLSEEV